MQTASRIWTQTSRYKTVFLRWKNRKVYKDPFYHSTAFKGAFLKGPLPSCLSITSPSFHTRHSLMHLSDRLGKHVIQKGSAPASPPAQPPAAVATAVVVSPSSSRLPAIACKQTLNWSLFCTFPTSCNSRQSISQN